MPAQIVLDETPREPTWTDLFVEGERLATFENWPLDFLTPKTLSSAGFHFLGTEDVVMCTFCGITLGSWHPGDDPKGEHLKRSPKCAFLELTSSMVPDFGPRSIEDPRESPPAFPHYSAQSSRMRSFVGWPSLQQKPEVLSEAGLFYTAISDLTMCFHCGVHLENWKATDEPWAEHARRSPTCPFVLEVKGADFVNEFINYKKILYSYM